LFRKAQMDKITNEIKNDVIEIVDAIEWDANYLAPLITGSYSWQNPYYVYKNIQFNSTQ
jgi:hypothetical protein